MDAATTVLLVMLIGTPVEHVIAMDSLDSCRAAAADVNNAVCLTPTAYEQRKADAARRAAASAGTPRMKPSSEAMAEPDSAYDHLPSATVRRLRRVMTPSPDQLATVPPPGRRPSRAPR